MSEGQPKTSHASTPEKAKPELTPEEVEQREADEFAAAFASESDPTEVRATTEVGWGAIDSNDRADLDAAFSKDAHKARSRVRADRVLEGVSQTLEGYGVNAKNVPEIPIMQKVAERIVDVQKNLKGKTGEEAEKLRKELQVFQQDFSSFQKEALARIDDPERPLALNGDRERWERALRLLTMSAGGDTEPKSAEKKPVEPTSDTSPKAEHRGEVVPVSHGRDVVPRHEGAVVPSADTVIDGEAVDVSAEKKPDLTAEEREARAQKLAERAGVADFRREMIKAEDEWARTEAERIKKTGVLKRGTQALVNWVLDRERTSNEKEKVMTYGAAYHTALRERMENRLAEKRKTAKMREDATTFGLTKQKRDNIDAFYQRVEERYLKQILGRETVARGHEKVAQMTQVAQMDKREARLEKLPALKWLAKADAYWEQKMGKTGKRVSRSLAFSIIGAGTVAAVAPGMIAGGVAMYGTVRAARGLGGMFLGTYFGQRAERRYLEKNAEKRRSLFGEALKKGGVTTEDYASLVRTYAENTEAKINRTAKLRNMWIALAVGGGTSLLSGLALEHVEHAVGLGGHQSIQKPEPPRNGVVGSFVEEPPQTGSGTAAVQHFEHMLQPHQHNAIALGATERQMTMQSNLEHFEGMLHPHDGSPVPWEVAQAQAAHEHASGLPVPPPRVEAPLPTVEVHSGQGFESMMHEWTKEAAERGVTASDFRNGSYAHQLLEAQQSGDPHKLSEVMRKIALENGVLKPDGSSEILHQGARMTFDAHGNIVMNQFPSDHVTAPVGAEHVGSAAHAATEHATQHASAEHAGGAAQHEPSAAQTTASSPENFGPATTPTEKLNAYILEHPGAKGPFIFNQHGNIVGEVSQNQDTLFNTNTAPPKGFVSVGGKNVTPPNGLEQTGNAIVNVNGLQVNPKVPHIYEVKGGGLAVYGGTLQEKMQLIHNYLYKHPGTELWYQGEGMIKSSQLPKDGMPYVERMLSAKVGDNVGITHPDPVPPKSWVGRVITPNIFTKLVQ